MHLALATLILSVISHAQPSSSLLTPNHVEPPPLKHANHIFNAIHSSMRQWGSSLNHNGMSFFLAHIPAGTEFYHGRGDNITVTGMEWLAFEPEHAMNFARKIVHKHPPPKDGHAFPDEHEFTQQHISRDVPHDFTADTYSRRQQLLGRPPPSSKPPPPHQGPNPDFHMLPGYLHTYTTLQPLRLLYLDGESAAKSSLGTLDTQDYILAPHARDSGPAGGDYARGHNMCSLAANEWEGRIDGFIRMEHGFELIICDFAKSMELARMQRVENWTETQGDGAEFLFSFLRAITARYDGIGGGRVTVEDGEFVSVFAEEGVDLWGGRSSSDSDHNTLPRLKNITTTQRERLMAKITTLVLKDPNPPYPPPISYQSITDLLTTRYSSALQTLASATPPLNVSSVHQSLSLLLRPFIDYDHRDVEMEVRRCTMHFLTKVSEPPSLAHNAIREVSRRICETLFSALSASSISSPTITTCPSPASASSIRHSIQSLISFLRWSSFKSCQPGCPFSALCFTAIWPVGDARSHETPYCVDVKAVGEVAQGPRGGSYWDWEGGRR